MNKIRKTLEDIGYAIKLVFHASPKFFVLKFIVSLVLSLLPFAPIYVWKRLLNKLISYPTEQSGNLVDTIWLLAISYCAIMLFEKVMDTASQFIAYKYNDEISYYMDNLMVDKVSSVDLAFFDSSDLQDKMNNSWLLVDSTQYMVSFVFDFFLKVIRLVVSLLLILELGWWIAPITVILSIPSVLGDKRINEINYLVEKKSTNLKRRMDYAKSIFFGDQRQEIVLYNLKDYFVSLYTKSWTAWNGIIQERDKKGVIVSSLSILFSSFTEIIVYILAIVKLISGKIGAGDVTYYVSLMAQFREDFTSLCYRINVFQKNSSELNDIRSFVEMKPLLEKSGNRIPKGDCRIEFINVSFRYPGQEQYVLQNCSFTIRPREKVGLVGLNGSGKSTIVKLLCRFYDPTEGQILIDGTDVREYELNALRKLFGVLFQDYVQYSFTLRENIAMSDISKMNCDEEILAAAEQSRVTDFMSGWEKGLEESLTRQFDSEGKELSGGQWQRVSLARAFFRDAPIVLLDEPSAALDPVAEHEIFEDFSKISEDKSAVLISHRLSSITLCDRILVLTDGHIAEQGSHTELMEKNGEYARLFHLQASKYL